MTNKILCSIFGGIKFIRSLILSISYVFILGVSASSAATIDIESGSGSLTPTIINGPGSLGQFPGGGKFAFETNIEITDFHFDLPSLAQNDVTFDTGSFLTGLTSQTMAGANPSSSVLWLFFDPIPIGTTFTIDMDVTVDELEVTVPTPATISLLIIGFGLMGWKQKRVHQ